MDIQRMLAKHKSKQAQFMSMGTLNTSCPREPLHMHTHGQKAPLEQSQQLSTSCQMLELTSRKSGGTRKLENRPSAPRNNIQIASLEAEIVFLQGKYSDNIFLLELQNQNLREQKNFLTHLVQQFHARESKYRLSIKKCRMQMQMLKQQNETYKSEFADMRGVIGKVEKIQQIIQNIGLSLLYPQIQEPSVIIQQTSLHKYDLPVQNISLIRNSKVSINLDSFNKVLSEVYNRQNPIYSGSRSHQPSARGGILSPSTRYRPKATPRFHYRQNNQLQQQNDCSVEQGYYSGIQNTIKQVQYSGIQNTIQTDQAVE